jgi:hypothetical protein
MLIVGFVALSLLALVEFVRIGLQHPPDAAGPAPVPSAHTGSPA